MKSTFSKRLILTVAAFVIYFNSKTSACIDSCEDIASHGMENFNSSKFMGSYCVVAIVTVQGAIGPGISCIKADYTKKPKEHNCPSDEQVSGELKSSTPKSTSYSKSNFDVSLTCTMTDKSLSPIKLQWATEASQDHPAWDVSCDNVTQLQKAKADIEDSCEEKRASHSCCGEHNPTQSVYHTVIKSDCGVTLVSSCHDQTVPGSSSTVPMNEMFIMAKCGHKEDEIASKVTDYIRLAGTFFRIGQETVVHQYTDNSCCQCSSSDKTHS